MFSKLKILFKGKLVFINFFVSEWLWKLRLTFIIFFVGKKNNLEIKEEQSTSLFAQSEEKAVLAIQKHAMNIAGKEKNPQMDEAYFLLGQSRYYDQRFIPSLEAFNYILFKYPTSELVNKAKIWRLLAGFYFWRSRS